MNVRPLRLRSQKANSLVPHGCPSAASDRRKRPCPHTRGRGSQDRRPRAAASPAPRFPRRSLLGTGTEGAVPRHHGGQPRTAGRPVNPGTRAQIRAARRRTARPRARPGRAAPGSRRQDGHDRAHADHATATRRRQEGAHRPCHRSRGSSCASLLRLAWRVTAARRWPQEAPVALRVAWSATDRVRTAAGVAGLHCPCDCPSARVRRAEVEALGGWPPVACAGSG